MGNPAWGHGFHTGYAKGAKIGGVIGVGGTLALGGLAKLAVWIYGKAKTKQAMKSEQEYLERELADEIIEGDGENADPELPEVTEEFNGQMKERKPEDE